MLCSEIMKRDVEYCLDSSLVTEAAEAMRRRDLGFLPVCTLEGDVVGALTDRDIVVRGLAEERPSDATLARDLMSAPVVHSSPDDEVAVAEDRMSRMQKSRIVCLDERGRLAGVISLSGLARIALQAHAGAVAASIAMREAAVTAGSARASALACRDVMKTDVAYCRLEDTVTSAAKLMRDRGIGFLPVCDERGATVGTLTDRDLVVRVVAERRDATTTRARDVLTKEVVSCAPEDPLRAAEDLMVRHHKARILCLDERRRPAGVISLADVARIEPADVVQRLVVRISSRTEQYAA